MHESGEEYMSRPIQCEQCREPFIREDGKTFTQKDLIDGYAPYSYVEGVSVIKWSGRVAKLTNVNRDDKAIQTLYGPYVCNEICNFKYIEYRRLDYDYDRRK